ncbi:MAG: tetratricopeptide repeat protein, partial [Gammaproteobacteria bacterium]|nr:tetratricopeptide repeat protein [Gammaproteobacteria bacterium]
AYTNIGTTYFLQKDIVMAEKLFRKALQLDPDNKRAQKGLQVISKLK